MISYKHNVVYRLYQFYAKKKRISSHRDKERKDNNNNIGKIWTFKQRHPLQDKSHGNFPDDDKNYFFYRFELYYYNKLKLLDSGITEET